MNERDLKIMHDLNELELASVTGGAFPTFNHSGNGNTVSIANLSTNVTNGKIVLAAVDNGNTVVQNSPTYYPWY
jgi:hypothetical protein